ncbi:MAG: hypothetical protein JWQ44_2461 [Chthoniobacter sp.]|nr:hypothetical protein [Chthoniobacter sp.]
MWADTFHAGLRNSSETSALVAAARAANCNALFVEVRKRGDAYYRDGLEPVATDVVAGFDPLADLITKAHAGPERLEVHAWMVTYNIWNNGNIPPSQPTHPFNLHPEWLTQNNVGAQFDSSNYQLDPGHPEVQAHTFDVAADILNRYDVDGIHLDYVRYSEHSSSLNSQPWGYNPVSVARFKKLKNRTTTPAINDSVWLQWRRDQVTALVRRLYLHAWATKPHVRISAALIPWGTAPAENASLTAWQNTEAYGRVLQDWRGWMEEGILDLACPMVYGTSNSGFSGWANFTRERQYNRMAALGMGWYNNPISSTIAKVKIARGSSAGGKTSSGVVGYSYAVPNVDGISRAETWAAFTDDVTAESYDPGGTPVFANPVATPSMPWKTNTARGHLMGFVGNGLDTKFDGTTISLAGPVDRSLLADANGFFGAVDLPVGNYTATVTRPGYAPVTQNVAVTGATVAQRSLGVQRLPFRITSLVRTPAPANKLTISWNSLPGRTYRIEGAAVPGQWSPIASGVSATTGSSTYEWTVPAAWGAQAYIRVVEEP